jgi:hypothetical protein
MGGFLFSPFADLISNPPEPIRFQTVTTRDGLQDLLAPAISYSFDPF